jgi:hypothetical protein
MKRRHNGRPRVGWIGWTTRADDADVDRSVLVTEGFCHPLGREKSRGCRGVGLTMRGADAESSPAVALGCCRGFKRGSVLPVDRGRGRSDNAGGRETVRRGEGAGLKSKDRRDGPGRHVARKMIAVLGAAHSTVEGPTARSKGLASESWDSGASCFPGGKATSPRTPQVRGARKGDALGDRALPGIVSEALDRASLAGGGWGKPPGPTRS